MSCRKARDGDGSLVEPIADTAPHRFDLLVARGLVLRGSAGKEVARVVQHDDAGRDVADAHAIIGALPAFTLAVPTFDLSGAHLELEAEVTPSRIMNVKE